MFIALPSHTAGIEHAALDEPDYHSDESRHEDEEEDPEAPADHCAVFLFAILAGKP